MAFHRMMGVDSVDYHRETVIDRADDHPGRALGYYTERGESPLTWGGSGAVRLGLEGHVRLEHYEDIFGRGGARDPITGTLRLGQLRPGLELVVSAHKSVAELGVMGRVEDMHAILDAERDGTMAYLDELTRSAGVGGAGERPCPQLRDWSTRPPGTRRRGRGIRARTITC